MAEKQRKVPRSVGRFGLISLAVLIVGACMFHLGFSVVGVRETKPVVLVNGSIRTDGKVFITTFGDLIVSADYFYLLKLHPTRFEVFDLSHQYKEVGPYLVRPLIDEELQVAAPGFEPIPDWKPMPKLTQDRLEFRGWKNVRIEVRGL